MKFSIVTPTFNSEKYLNETMLSVVSQKGCFDIEYIIADNMSDDATANIVDSFNSYVKNSDEDGSLEIKFIRVKDGGMYEAINRGFSLATGDVYAWINSDDVYCDGAFELVAAAFSLSESVRWVKGITSYIDEEGAIKRSGRCFLYSQDLVRRGLYGREAYFIQQDSVFWRSELWREAGGLDESFKFAGDYDLWLRFARFAPLYSLKQEVSCFRRVAGQLSENMQAYREEQTRKLSNDTLRIRLLRRFFSSFEQKLPEWGRFLLFRLLCPNDPLYYIDGEIGAMKIRTSTKYMV